ncbi:ankyrin repeat domain-containing protein [Candidatus Cardinium hertigii]|uniref:Uncharacterized protein n=1 Tax=Candidatus Cardinium hertigii TaxID=247481 RepID=A0A2Z3L9P4_9BACT|nr:ankyrin repeat domain-containing protein [Candidatus Cardinium hertigii]AWN82077.1 hypothetical protein DK880_00768 [Candidatus Cardinium hertigii]
MKVIHNIHNTKCDMIWFLLFSVMLVGCSRAGGRLGMMSGTSNQDQKGIVSKEEQFIKKEKEIEKSQKKKEYGNEFFPNDTIKTMQTSKGSICDIDYYYDLFDKYSQEKDEIAIDVLRRHASSPLNPMAMLSYIIKEGSSEMYNSLPTLFIAIYKGRTTICKFLLDKGADINQYASVGSVYGAITPLHLAVIEKRKEVLNLLLQDNKLNINAINSRNSVSGDSRSWTALYLAVYDDNKDIVSLLLQHAKINPNIQSGFGHTPLHIAASKNSLEIIKLLLQHDKNKSFPINPNIQNWIRETPLHIACNLNWIEIIKLLLKHGQDKAHSIDIYIQNRDGRKALEVDGNRCIADLFFGLNLP